MKQDREGEKGKKGELAEQGRIARNDRTGSRTEKQSNRDREPAKEILEGEKEGEVAGHKHRQKTGGTGKGKEKEKEKKNKQNNHSSVGERRIQGRARDAEEGRQGPGGPPLTADLALGAAGRLCRFRRFSLLRSSLPLP